MKMGCVKCLNWCLYRGIWEYRESGLYFSLGEIEVLVKSDLNLDR